MACNRRLWIFGREWTFVFVDRLKRMVKISGMNVFPNEIEHLLAENITEIDKCCVVDFIQKGKPYLKLFVKMKDGFVFSTMLEQKIRQIITTNLIEIFFAKSSRMFLALSSANIVL